MGQQTYFEYDEKRQVLIKLSPGQAPKIIRKGEPSLRPFGPGDDRYARAIFQGQGCWEDLTTITEEEGDKILKGWQ